MNYDKTEILRIGSLRNTDLKIIMSQEYKWTNQPIKILGVYLTNDNSHVHDLNIIPQLTKIGNLSSIWGLWDTTPYWCIIIVKHISFPNLLIN